MKKKIILSLAICFLITGCSRPLANLTEEAIEIDMTRQFEPSSVLSDIKEGTKIDYQLDEENSRLLITLKNKDQTETIETDVTLLYPEYTLQEDISIDTYKGYDINDLVSADPGTTITSSLDEENGILTITLTNGIWSKTIEKQVNVENSFPMGIWVNYDKVYDGYWTYDASTIVFNEDHRGYIVCHQKNGSFCIAELFEWDDEGNIILQGHTYLISCDKTDYWFKVEDGVLYSDLPIYGNGETHEFRHDDGFCYECVPNPQIPPYRNPKPDYSSFEHDYNEIEDAYKR